MELRRRAFVKALLGRADSQSVPKGKTFISSEKADEH